MEINESNNSLVLSGFSASNPNEFVSSLMESFNIPADGSTPQVTLNRKNMIYQEGTYIKDCSFLVTPEICQECMFNSYLIENTVILEGAKLDLTLKNFLKEGKDYKGLKKDVQEIVDAFGLDDDKLKSGRKPIMHTIKRILQVLTDLSLPIDAATAVASGVGAGTTVKMLQGAKTIYDYSKNMWVTVSPAVYATTYNIPIMVITAIIGLIITFLVNRLWRLLWDYIEYETIKSDAESVIRQLRRISNTTKDKKLKKKCEDSIKKLQDKLDEYEKKDKEEKKKEKDDVKSKKDKDKKKD